MQVPAELKALTPYIRRAEELDKDGRDETRVVAYYCRQYAMELGISLQEDIADKATAQGFLLSLIERLEKDKNPSVSKEEGEQIVFKFASEVFDRADAEDRGRGATKATARTFYASSVFFDTLKQFGDRGSEADEKCRYAKWKAADILKAIKEGREPTVGGPADEQQAETLELPPLAPTAPPALEIPVAPEKPPQITQPNEPGPAFDQQPDAHSVKQQPDPPAIKQQPDAPAIKEQPDVPPPAFEPRQPEVPRAPKQQQQQQHHEEPPPRYTPQPTSTTRAVAPRSVPRQPVRSNSTLSDAQLADALELARFAVAALEIQDTNLAAQRLQDALAIISRP